MNDIRYKPDNWSKQTAKRVMYGVGYHGIYIPTAMKNPIRDGIG